MKHIEKHNGFIPHVTLVCRQSAASGSSSLGTVRAGPWAGVKVCPLHQRGHLTAAQVCMAATNDTIGTVI